MITKPWAQSSPTAFDLQRVWFDSLNPSQKISHQDIVGALMKELRLATPSAFYSLLALKKYQIFKQKHMDRYYPSVLVFVWQKALEEVCPTQAVALLPLFERTFFAQMPQAKQRLDTIGRHLALFAVITDNFATDGFIGVAHHVVLRVLGDIEQNPNNLISSVRLAHYLDTRFEAYIDQFRHSVIHL